MKIIDILNKIANEEETPSKIKYNDKMFIYDGFSYIYDNKTFNEYNRLEDFISYGSDLNDEVEILKEKKMPEKLDIYDELQSLLKDNNIDEHNLHKMLKKIELKQNEIIDYLKRKGE